MPNLWCWHVLSGLNATPHLRRGLDATPHLRRGLDATPHLRRGLDATPHLLLSTHVLLGLRRLVIAGNLDPMLGNSHPPRADSHKDGRREGARRDCECENPQARRLLVLAAGWND